MRRLSNGSRVSEVRELEIPRPKGRRNVLPFASKLGFSPVYISIDPITSRTDYGYRVIQTNRRDGRSTTEAVILLFVKYQLLASALSASSELSSVVFESSVRRASDPSLAARLKTHLEIICRQNVSLRSLFYALSVGPKTIMKLSVATRDTALNWSLEKPDMVQRVN